MSASTETDTMRALAAEARETVVLTRQFYSCVVKDPRTSSGEFHAAGNRPLPSIEGFRTTLDEKAKKPV
jgi:hypothetical protein